MKNTKIPWATNSWSPWWGCTKLPDRRACDACYAAAFAHRIGRGCWGDTAPRLIASERVWSDPTRWNEKAKRAGARPRVFCMSMGDFLEDRPDLVEPRARAVRIIEETPSLEWLILTKRINNAHLLPWAPCRFPAHVRMGITVEDQRAAERDVPRLLALDCRNVVSVEPMLGPVDLSPWLRSWCPGCELPLLGGRHFTGRACGTCHSITSAVEWVICGCESAPGKRLGRPLELDWVRALRDQCQEAGVPFFYKQGPVDGRLVELPELDGRSWAMWP